MYPLNQEPDRCLACGCPWIGGSGALMGIEYPNGHPECYDGVSEWRCMECGARWDRWTGKALKSHEMALRPR